MKTFRTEDHGEFACTLVRDKLSFHGTHNHVHLTVPDFMQAEGRRLLRRECGDKVLDFARLCIVHEVALSACGE